MDDSFATGYALGNDNNKNDDGMMGGGFIWIIMIVLLFGMGGNGGMFGGGNGGNGVTKSDLCEGFNFNDLQRSVDRVGQGICDSTYALNTSILNGFHGTDLQICGVNQNIDSCCCTTNRNIDQTRFDMSRGFCDVIQAGHNDADRIIAVLTQDKIESLRTELQSAQLQLSNAAQTNAIVNAVRPSPIPSFPTCNPWATQNNCGCGCGCN